MRTLQTNTASPRCWGSSTHTGLAPRQNPSSVSETSHLTLGCMWLGVPGHAPPPRPAQDLTHPARVLCSPWRARPPTRSCLCCSAPRTASVVWEMKRKTREGEPPLPSLTLQDLGHSSVTPSSGQPPSQHSLGGRMGGQHSCTCPRWHSLCSRCFVTTNKAAINILVHA